MTFTERLKESQPEYKELFEALANLKDAAERLTVAKTRAENKAAEIATANTKPLITAWDMLHDSSAPRGDNGVRMISEEQAKEEQAAADAKYITSTCEVIEKFCGNVTRLVGRAVDLVIEKE